jgi:hypothetical protein
VESSVCTDIAGCDHLGSPSANHHYKSIAQAHGLVRNDKSTIIYEVT